LAVALTTIRGFKDILPDETPSWHFIESQARRLFHVFGFREIRTPLLERTELFSRGIGLDTDIVSKEMYSFEDSQGVGVSLRPEATASVVRAYIEHRLYDSYPVQKLFTIGPMFRRERPQKGRFRQFHQINAELFGDPGPKTDAEMIHLAVGLLEAFGLGGLTLRLNSLGCNQCRETFRVVLRDFLGPRQGELCSECSIRSERNPLRVFDCKVEPCRQIVGTAPSIVEFLCDPCRAHFETLQALLTSGAINFTLDHRLVRGLDYYTRTAFEIQTDRLGAQNAVAGGGRYDGLVHLLGGPAHPAIGFAVGVERVLALLDQHPVGQARGPDLFIAALGAGAEEAAVRWQAALRRSGIWVEIDYARGGLKAQMKKADRLGARRVLLVGDEELASGKGILRDMATRSQDHVPLSDLESILKEMLQM
jgi:histidyl-tRNA synthetase